MNLVRYYLALCILMGHFSYLTGIEAFQLPRIFGGAGSFFALSGFLMFPSYEKRPQAKRFFARRSRRIFPPYVLIVIVAAVGLVFLSDLGWKEYFTSAGFWKYLVANLFFLNFLAPDLPGVFADITNNIASVNGSLWTMKGEIICYLSVPLVYKLIERRKDFIEWILLGLVAISLLMNIILEFNGLNGMSGSEVLRKQFQVFMLFYFGAWINLRLPQILRYKYTLIVLNLLILGTDYLGLLNFTASTMIVIKMVLINFATGSMVILCSMVGKWGHFLSGHNAVSYDIYLFHWPVIQVLICVGLVGKMGYWPALIMTIVVVVVMAFLSWNMIGKQFLKNKKTKKVPLLTDPGI